MNAPVRPVVTPGLDSELDEAMELIHFAFRRVVESADRLLATRSMGRLHHRLLYVIGHNPGIEVGQTVELLGITKQAAHAPLRALVQGGLVRTERDPADGRRKRLLLTEEGQALERRLAALQHEVFAEAFAVAGEEAVEGWLRVSDLLGGGCRLKV